MGFQFRPAVREQIRLLLGLSGGTGSGKTYSAMRLAKGLSGDKRFAVIDTENGRASMYADFFNFDVSEFQSPFTPDRYFDAITAAEKAGYGVILVDSMSHEWAGEGGILDMHEDLLEKFTRGDDSKRDAHNMRAWIEPKMSHKSMVAHLLQLRAHVIMCFRAEPKVDIKKEGGKTKIVPKETLTGLDGWVPICEKNLPYELTASFLLMAEQPGIPKPIKLQEQHKPFFDLTKPITEECGMKLAAWASGGRPNVSIPKGGNHAITPPSPPQSTEPQVSEDKGSAEGADAGGGDAVAVFKAIEACTTLLELDELGMKIQGTLTSPDDVATALKLFAAKTKQIKAALKNQPPEPEKWI